MDKVERALQTLRDSGRLDSTAVDDLQHMIRIHKTGDLLLNSSASATYPFLIAAKSTGGIALRDELRGYAGDWITLLIEKSRPGPPTDWTTFLSAAVSTRFDTHGALSSRELLACVVSYSRHVERADPGFGYIGDFLEAVGSNQKALIRTLLDPGSRSSDTSLVERYSLVLRATASGMISAEIMERWGRHGIIDDESTVSAPHGLMIPERVVFRPDEILAFEDLLNRDPPAPEEAFQEFFEAHPKWLYLLGEQYESYQPQVRLPPVQIRDSLSLVDGAIDSGEFVPDFMLKRIGLELWDVLDIKRAHPPVVVGGRGRRKFGEAVSQSVAQLREYGDRLRQNEVRAFLRQHYGITVARPVAMVVIGRDFEFRTLREKDLMKSSEGVKVYTYDDLRRLARHRTLVL